MARKRNPDAARKLRRRRRQARAEPEPAPRAVTPGEAAVMFVDGIARGRTPACKRLKQMINLWLDAISSGKAEYRPQHVDEIAAWCAERLKFLTGPKEGQPWTMDPYQCWIAALMFGTFKAGTDLPLYRTMWWAAGKNTAKALHDDTPIPTPDGWTRMGDLKPGDLVFDERGKPCSVLSVHPQGVRPVYRVGFSDGSHILADAEHRWTTTTHLWRRSCDRKDWPTSRRADWTKREPVTTSEIAASLRHGASYNHAIPVAGRLQLPERELPFDPYCLGVWLGDGDSRGSVVTASRDDAARYEPRFRAAGFDWRTRPDKRNPNVLACKFGNRTRSGPGHTLSAMGVLGNKHIPPEYLRASDRQRLDLLQGLMDSDGTCTKNRVQFTNVNARLALGVLELARSLGEKPTIRTTRAKLYGDDKGFVYYVSWRPHHQCFKLPRKRALVEPVSRQVHTSRQRTVRSVELAGEGPCTCIRVSSDSSLFLAGEAMVPTHNTALCAAFAMVLLCHPDYRRRNTILPIMSVDGVQSKSTLFGDIGKLASENREHFPELNLTTVNGKVTEIVNTETGTSCVPFSREAQNNRAGIHTCHVFVDEWANMKDRAAVAQATGGYKDRTAYAQTWFLLNGGDDTDAPAYQDYQAYCAVLDGAREAEGVAVVICQFDRSEDHEHGVDWENPVEWRKANPLIGSVIDEEYYRSEAAKARVNPAQLPEFVRLWGCQFVHRAEGWLDTERWNGQLVDQSLTFDDFRGRRKFAGLDLARVGDFVSYFVLADDGLTEDGRPRYIGFVRAFTSTGKHGLKAKAEREGRVLDYEWMAGQKHLLVNAGLRVDFGYVAQTLMADLGEDDAQLAYDSQYMEEFLEYGAPHGVGNVPMHRHPQRKDTWANDPTKLSMTRSIGCAEDLFFSGRLRVMPNPLMTHALNGAVIQTAPGSSFRGFGKAAVGKVKTDPAVAYAMAAGLANLIASQPEPEQDPDDDKTPEEIMDELGFAA